MSEIDAGDALNALAEAAADVRAERTAAECLAIDAITDTAYPEIER